MDIQTRTPIVVARADIFFHIQRTAMFVLLGTLAVHVFAQGAAHIWVLSASIVGAALYGVLAGNAAMKDIQALREDMDEETRDSNYGKSVLAQPFPVFRGLLFIIYLAIAITQLMMVHS